ncbi:hypothetical protein GmHk_17G049259 [Glycine max]|nr:hypothetical protein GmHk_17G049259 [Glycine max]
MVPPPASPPPPLPPPPLPSNASASPSAVKRTRKASRLRSLSTRPPGADRPVFHAEFEIPEAFDSRTKKKLLHTVGERWRRFKLDLTRKWALAADQDGVDDTVCEKYDISKEKWAQDSSWEDVRKKAQGIQKQNTAPHRSGQSQFETESYIKSWMQSSKCNVYLRAYLNGGHWQMVVIMPNEHLVVWFCSLHNRPDKYLKGIINSALKGLHDAPQPKSKAPTRWIVVKYFNDPRPLEPKRLKALRIQWAQYYLRVRDQT